MGPFHAPDRRWSASNGRGVVPEVGVLNLVFNVLSELKKMSSEFNFICFVANYGSLSLDVHQFFNRAVCFQSC